MKDSYGRNIDYLRISVTDRCNLRCLYCMPEDIDLSPMSDILTFEDLASVACAAAKLGISKIKITGGEPLVRRDVCHLIRMLKDTHGIDQVTLTTNGMLLGRFLTGLIDAGIDGINVSLDTLDRGRYGRITGHDGLETVLDGINKAAGSNIPVKINAVSVDWDRYFGTSKADDAPAIPEDVKALIGLAEDQPVDVRFIELMPIGYGKDFPGIPHDILIPQIKALYDGMTEADRRGNGPAVYYKIPGYKGRIGFISAIHGKFCNECNRIRLTSKGYLKSCLCYDTGVDIKSIVRQSDLGAVKQERLVRAFEQCILSKPDSHSFTQKEKITEKLTMSAIGG